MSEEKDQHWQHWDSVTVLRKNKRQLKDNGSTKSSLTNPNINVEKKGGNREIGSKLAKLDNAEEAEKIETVSLSLSQKIQQGRAAKGMKQKDLATKINVKPQVIGDYESGRAVPDNKILGKIERALGIKLRGKGK
jgi:putative transcription factor